MTNYRNRYPGRRKFLKQSAALSAGAAALAAPVRLIAGGASEPNAPPDMAGIKDRRADTRYPDPVSQERTRRER
jgi:hypothetical protein